MKNLKKYLICLFIFLIPICVSASSIEPDYDVVNAFVNVDMDVLGSLHIKEAYVIKGSLNGFRREINYRNDVLKDWEEGNVDFNNSSIYNAKGISFKKASSEKINKEEIGWTLLDKSYTSFTEKTFADKGDNSVYTIYNGDDGIEAKIYDTNTSGYKVYYFEYYVDQAAVLHNDIAELYYTVFKLNDDVKRVNFQVTTPGYSNKENFRVFAHGSLNGMLYTINEDGDENSYKGAHGEVEDYKKDTPLEIRMLFDKSLVSLGETLLNNSEMDAKEEIIEIELDLAKKTDEQKRMIKVIYYGTCVIAGLYIVGLVFIWIYMYRKYDKEYDVGFDHDYYREFTDEYDVEVVDYVMNKNISTNAFNASILNLIYKKNIKIEEFVDDEKNATLIFQNDKNVSKAEKIILELLFDEIGENGRVTLKEIQKYSSKYTTAEKFMKKYDAWKLETTRTAESLDFYENNYTPRAIATLYFLLGVLIFVLLLVFNVEYYFLHILVLGGGIAFLIYIWSFRKWTKKGRLDFLKWKGFKKFLLDFGSFDDKEVMDIHLWDRYLVYATVLGIADKVQSIMKVKLSEMNTSDIDVHTSVFMYRDFYIVNSLNSSMTKAHTNSISTISAHNASSSSSGTGFGGGFSGGGGFAGAGGGGGGF